MKIPAILLSMLFCSVAFSQENYEIQVYSSPTMTRGCTIFELHSNFTFDGEKNIVDGVRPSWHSLHETLEITQGITDNFEIGFYLFTNYTSPYGYKIVGSHIRPRVRVPEKWNWPVGVSLSAEFGFQRKAYSPETWNIEVRPIVDKQWHNFYLSFNPTFGIGLKGVDKGNVSFEPNLKLAYTLGKLALGMEYYGDIGPLSDIPSSREQGHAIFVVADLYFDPKWEVNIGPGFGLTPATDGFVFKLLVGRRICWNKKSKSS